ncbi:MAG TPA: hypothetical protein VFG51_01975 [Candidatus Saccharimonadia bacterium]|nr:hypothetical protein [Candidatus Saccharimonadia bacterium]
MLPNAVELERPGEKPTGAEIANWLMAAFLRTYAPQGIALDAKEMYQAVRHVARIARGRSKMPALNESENKTNKEAQKAPRRRSKFWDIAGHATKIVLRTAPVIALFTSACAELTGNKPPVVVASPTPISSPMPNLNSGTPEAGSDAALEADFSNKIDQNVANLDLEHPSTMWEIFPTETYRTVVNQWDETKNAHMRTELDQLLGPVAEIYKTYWEGKTKEQFVIFARLAVGLNPNTKQNGIMVSVFLAPASQDASGAASGLNDSKDKTPAAFLGTVFLNPDDPTHPFTQVQGLNLTVSPPGVDGEPAPISGSADVGHWHLVLASNGKFSAVVSAVDTRTGNVFLNANVPGQAVFVGSGDASNGDIESLIKAIESVTGVDNVAFAADSGPIEGALESRVNKEVQSPDGYRYFLDSTGKVMQRYSNAGGNYEVVDSGWAKNVLKGHNLAYDDAKLFDITTNEQGFPVINLGGVAYAVETGADAWSLASPDATATAAASSTPDATATDAPTQTPAASETVEPNELNLMYSAEIPFDGRTIKYTLSTDKLSDILPTWDSWGMLGVTSNDENPTAVSQTGKLMESLLFSVSQAGYLFNPDGSFQLTLEEFEQHPEKYPINLHGIGGVQSFTIDQVTDINMLYVPWNDPRLLDTQFHGKKGNEFRDGVWTILISSNPDTQNFSTLIQKFSNKPGLIQLVGYGLADPSPAIMDDNPHDDQAFQAQVFKMAGYAQPPSKGLTEQQYGEFVRVNALWKIILKK